MNEQTKFFIGVASVTKQKWWLDAKSKTLSPTKECAYLFSLPIIASRTSEGRLIDSSILAYKDGYKAFEHFKGNANGVIV